MTSKIFQALIVDDEIHAQEDLEAVIDKVGGIDIIGKARNLEVARSLILEHNPNLIFLDINLPGETGFELLNDISPKVKVIFVTAFEEFAVKAFEVDAQDYLLKPVSTTRLQNTLKRIRAGQISEQPSSPSLGIGDSMFVKLNSNYRFLKLSDILVIEAADYYSKLYLKNGDEGLVHKSLKTWEKLLPESHFQRIHRSHIICIDEVRNILPWFNKSYKIYINNIDLPFVLSRRYFAKIRELRG